MIQRSNSCQNLLKAQPGEFYIMGIHELVKVRKSKVNSRKLYQKLENGQAIYFLLMYNSGP